MDKVRIVIEYESILFRIDLISQVLHYGAVHYGRKVVVFDQVLGLMSAAIIERSVDWRGGG